MNNQAYEYLIEQVTEKVWQALQKPIQPAVICESVTKLPAKWKKELAQIGEIVSWSDGQKSNLYQLPKLLILDELSMEQLFSIRFLQTMDEKTAQVLNQLKVGRPVWVLQSFHDYANDWQQARYGLKKELANTQKVLESFGLRFMTQDYLFEQELAYIKTRVK